MAWEWGPFGWAWGESGGYRTGQEYVPRLAVDLSLVRSNNGFVSKPLPKPAIPLPVGPAPAPVPADIYSAPSFEPAVREPLASSETRPFRESVSIRRVEPGLQALVRCAWDDDRILAALASLMTDRIWVLTLQSRSARGPETLESKDLQAVAHEIARKLNRPKLSSFVPGGAGFQSQQPGARFQPSTPSYAAPSQYYFEPLAVSETTHPPKLSLNMLRLDQGTQALIRCAWNDRTMLASLLKLLGARLWMLTIQSRRYEYGGTAEGVNLEVTARNLQTVIDELLRRLRQL